MNTNLVNLFPDNIFVHFLFTMLNVHKNPGSKKIKIIQKYKLLKNL